MQAMGFLTQMLAAAAQKIRQNVTLAAPSAEEAMAGGRSCCILPVPPGSRQSLIALAGGGAGQCGVFLEKAAGH